MADRRTHEPQAESVGMTVSPATGTPTTTSLLSTPNAQQTAELSPTCDLLYRIASQSVKNLVQEYQDTQTSCSLPAFRGPVPVTGPVPLSASSSPPRPRLGPVPWSRWILRVEAGLVGCTDRLVMSYSLTTLHSLLSLLRARRKFLASLPPRPPSPQSSMPRLLHGIMGGGDDDDENESQCKIDDGVMLKLWELVSWVTLAFKTGRMKSIIVASGQCLRLFVLEGHAAQIPNWQCRVPEIAKAVQTVFTECTSMSLVVAVACRVTAALHKIRVIRALVPIDDLLPQIDRKIQSFCSWADWEREPGAPEIADAMCRLLEAKYRRGQQEPYQVSRRDVEWVAMLLKMNLPLRLTEKLVVITNTIATDALAVQDSHLLISPALACLKRHCYCDCYLSSTPKTCVTSPNLCVALHALLKHANNAIFLPSQLKIFHSVLSCGLMEAIVVVMNSHPSNVDVQVIGCQMIQLLLSGSYRQFSTIHPVVQAVLRAIDSCPDMGPFQDFALSVLLALVNYPRFASHRTVLGAVLRLKNRSETVWEVIAKASESHLEVNDAVEILHDLVAYLRPIIPLSPELAGNALKVVLHVVGHTGDSAAALQDLYWVSENFNPFSYPEVCEFIERMAVLSVPHLIDMGALNILMPALSSSKSIVPGCNAVMTLFQDNEMKDAISSKMKPVVIAAIEMLGPTSTTSEVYHLWRTLAALITSGRSTHLSSELQPVVTCILSGECSMLSHRVYEHILFLSKSESCSFLPVMQNIPELFPPQSFSKVAADIVDRMITSLGKDCRNSFPIPVPLVELLLEFALSVDEYISQSTWRSLIRLLKFKSGLETALKLCVIDILPHLAENIEKKEKRTQQEALKMLVRTFNCLQPHNIPRDTFLSYIQALLEQFSYIQRASFGVVWRGIACYFTGSSSSTLWEDVLLVMKKCPGLYKVQILALKTLHHSLALEHIKAINPSIEIISGTLSKEGKLSRNVRWCKWAFRVVTQSHPSYLVHNIVELVQREFVSFCFGALCPSQAKLCSSALKTLCFISSIPFGFEAINSVYDVGKIIAKIKTCKPNTVESLLYLLKSSVHDTPSAQSAQSQLDKLPILESFAMYGKGHKLYLDVYTKLLRYSSPSPPKFLAPAPPTSTGGGGKICQSHHPDILCFACYRFDQFHFCITCDGPSSSRNYCRGCIAASHYRHEISPPTLLVASCCCAPAGETTALTIIATDPNPPPEPENPSGGGGIDLSKELQAALPLGCRLGPGQFKVLPQQSAVHVPDARRYLLIRVHTERHFDIHRVAQALQTAAAAELLLCAARFPRVGNGGTLQSLSPLALHRIGQFLCPSPALLRLLVSHSMRIMEGPGPCTGSQPGASKVSALLKNQPQYTKGVEVPCEAHLPVCKHCWMQFERCQCPVVDNYWCRNSGMIISKCPCGCRQRVLDIQSGW